MLAAGWWDDAWPYRARIACPVGEGDVAFAHLALAGRTTPDGRDLRLIDADGRPRGFEILHHDPHLNTLIRFQVPPGKRLTTFLYYGNPDAGSIKTKNPGFTAFQEQWNAWKRNQAERNAALKKREPVEQELQRLRQSLRQAEDAGQTGPQVESLRRRVAQTEEELAAIAVPDALPQPEAPAAWYPRRGVLLSVYRKAKPGHPETLRDLRRLINDSALEGAGFRAGISDGFNPFGTSQQYISVYEGYLRIDQPGEYKFCTVSDDGSWVLVNNRTVVAWPGPHDIGGARRGQKNGSAALRPGVACVQYFQEQGTGAQMAFLGWQPPGGDHFVGVPRGQWLAVRRARAGAYEARGKPLLAVGRVDVESTYWIRDSESKQVAMVRFADQSRSRAGEITQRHWSFGDGLTGEGAQVAHVYFRLGRPAVTLTVTDAAGNRDSVTFAPHLFQTDVVARSRKYGKAGDYIAAAGGYDVERMERDDLALYVEFCGNLEQWPQHLRAAQSYLRRFADGPDVPRLAVAAAKSCLEPQAYNPQAADELLRLALQHTQPQRDRYNLVLRRAHVLAWHLDQPEPALRLYQELLDAAGSQPGRFFETLRRECLLGQADAALVAADYQRAEALYHRVEELNDQPIEQAEMLAKTGSYGYTVDDLLARGEYTWARQVLDKWEGEFPLQKLEGLTFFLRGKVLFVEQPGELALRYLDLAERVAPRAVHVPETVWLRANCYVALKRYKEALVELSRITADFTYSEFLERAAEKIKQCEAKLRTGM